MGFRLDCTSSNGIDVVSFQWFQILIIFIFLYKIFEKFISRRECICFGGQSFSSPLHISEEYASRTLSNQLNGFSVQSMQWINAAHYVGERTESRLSEPVREFLAFVINELFLLGIPTSQSLTKAAALITQSLAYINNIDTDVDLIKRTSEEFYEIVPFQGSIFRRPQLSDETICNSKMMYVGRLMLHVDALVQAHQLNNVNPLDNFVSDWLKLNITTLDRHTEDFNIFEEVVTKTQHPNVNRNFRIAEIFKVESTVKKPFTKKITDNHRYLLHYSHACNLLGILQEGLLVAPEHIQSVNRLLGKGIYFWNAIANSGLQYDSLNVVHVVVCRVALGRTKEFSCAYSQTERDEIVQLDRNNSGFQPGYKYMGVRSEEKILNGAKIYCGQIDEHDLTPERDWAAYDKYIVPNANQAKIEYILKLERSTKRPSGSGLSDSTKDEKKIKIEN